MAKSPVDILEKYLGQRGNFVWNYYNALPTGAAWCCGTVSYCSKKAGTNFYDGKGVFYVPTALAWLKKNATHVKMADAKKDDIIIFTWSGKGYNNCPSGVTRDHIGFIRKKGTSKVAYTIEGNTSGGIVARRTRDVKYVHSIWRLKSNTNDVKPSPSKPKKKATKSKTIYINPGHGNTDPGAVGKYSRTERQLNVVVASAMYKYLKDHYNCKLYMNKGTMESLSAICKSANNHKCDLFVSIHFNAGGGDGYEAWVYNSKRKSLGQMFEKHVKAIGQNSRGIKYSSVLKVLKLTNMPAILNECAFVDNKKDIQDWNDDAELAKMGVALAKAAAEYLGMKKVK